MMMRRRAEPGHKVAGKSPVPQSRTGQVSFRQSLCWRFLAHLQILSDAQDPSCNRGHTELFLRPRPEQRAVTEAGQSLGVRIVCVQAPLPHQTSLTKQTENFKVLSTERSTSGVSGSGLPPGPRSRDCKVDPFLSLLLPTSLSSFGLAFVPHDLDVTRSPICVLCLSVIRSLPH